MCFLKLQCGCGFIMAMGGGGGDSQALTCTSKRMGPERAENQQQTHVTLAQEKYNYQSFAQQVIITSGSDVIRILPL